MVLAFSGGEPLLRHDIFDLIERAVSRDLVVNIASNGALINHRMAKRLKQSGVRSVTISLDGATAELHDSIRRFPGLFEKCVAAIRTLSENGLNVVVSFTPMRLNYQDGPAVVELAVRLGAYGVNMSQYVPAGRGTVDLALDPPVLRDVIQQWIEMRRAYLGRVKIIWHDCRVSLLVPPEEQDRYSGCGAGKLTARLRVDGTLTPCVFLPNAAGNVCEEPFTDIWEHSPLLHGFRNRSGILDGNCGRCEHKLVCGGCRAVSMAHYGDPMKGDPSCWIYQDDTVRSGTCSVTGEPEFVQLGTSNQQQAGP